MATGPSRFHGGRVKDYAAAFEKNKKLFLSWADTNSKACHGYCEDAYENDLGDHPPQGSPGQEWGKTVRMNCYAARVFKKRTTPTATDGIEVVKGYPYPHCDVSCTPHTTFWRKIGKSPQTCKFSFGTC
ncbi:hypothetical protein FKW77_000052 [Venturia effusa]|uniref:Uncharacterized protein n=1 Tax=Venturia effusa TaxID=50376 RepID=A0A517KYU4_9PEZI|nr:hypothetical protein FKW77_000052 [Venturia effusa]